GPEREPLRLGEVLWARIGRLPEPRRRLLEVVAVAGRPLPLTEAAPAAGWEGDDWNALALLCSGALPLLRRTRRGESVLETYHDGIRETVVGHLPAEVRRQHHRRLAEVLRDSLRQADRKGPGGERRQLTVFEALAVHYREAGLDKEAVKFSILAAHR